MKQAKREKVVVGMSGGVDSSITLMLLKKRGYEPVGVSLKYEIWKGKENTLKENVCCSDESFQIARHICEKFGCEYHILNTKAPFKKEVVKYLIDELENNRTPNPCVRCNRFLKFKELFDFAKKYKIKYVATGHYARMKNGKLMKPKDKEKDQTYTLAFLDKKWLNKLLLPLGEYTKDQVYKMAKKNGLGFYLKRKESQDFCFVSGKAFPAFIKKEVGVKKGNIVDTSGIILGTHEGLHFYTIGQRKGLIIPNGPYFVCGMNVRKNELIVTRDGEHPKLFKKEIYLSPYNLFCATPEKKIRVKAKIRYQHSPADAEISLEKKRLKLIFTHPQKAVTLGQYAVFYKGDQCLGSGRIISAKA